MSEKGASLIRNVVLVICMVVLLLSNMTGDIRKKFADLGNYFNQTINEQSDALRYKV